MLSKKTPFMNMTTELAKDNLSYLQSSVTQLHEPNTITNVEMTEDPAPTKIITSVRPQVLADKPIRTEEIQMKTIGIETLSRQVSNKDGLYDALAFKGQLFLPPKSVCPLEFLGQLLQKKKRAFQLFETCPIYVPGKVKRVLTITRLLK